MKTQFSGTSAFKFQGSTARNLHENLQQKHKDKKCNKEVALHVDNAV